MLMRTICRRGAGEHRPRMQTAAPCPAGRASLQPSAGFTLIEVLIAVLVMSIGLLGIAALQTTTVQFNRGAYLRSQATSLAYDIADRMRANRTAALNGDYDVDFADPAPDCAAAGGDDVVEQDLSAWSMALACTLPLGNGEIDVADGIATISITWDETRGQRAAETFVMSTGL